MCTKRSVASRSIDAAEKPRVQICGNICFDPVLVGQPNWIPSQGMCETRSGNLHYIRVCLFFSIQTQESNSQLAGRFEGGVIRNYMLVYIFLRYIFLRRKGLGFKVLAIFFSILNYLININVLIKKRPLFLSMKGASATEAFIP